MGNILYVKLAVHVVIVLTRMRIAMAESRRANLTENCQEDHAHCGDVKISYPFGVTQTCSLGPNFLVTCNKSSDPYTAYLAGSHLAIIQNVRLRNAELDILQPNVAKLCHGSVGNPSYAASFPPSLTISDSKNELFSVGCDAKATLEGFAAEARLTASSASACRSEGYSIGRSGLPRGLRNFTVSLTGDHYKGLDRTCNFGFVASTAAFNNFSRIDNGFEEAMVPMVVEWSIGDVGCDVAMKLEDSYACLGKNSKCVDSGTGIGYVCQCLPGFGGNPYYPDGCLACGNECPNDSPPAGEQKNQRHKTEKAIEIGVSVLALFLITVVLGILWRMKYRRTTTRETELRGMGVQTGVFTYAQIKTATNNFNLANKIGEGGFGPVHKGTMRDGTIIAVKQLSSRSKQGNREFVTEIGLVSGLKHPNLVTLHGCCIDRNKLFLVYEYMENNSLARCLFNKEQLILDWPLRKKICVGVAKGLVFLHEESILKVVHRDIKATNILLDKDFSAKIADFGLAKLEEDENTHMSTRITGTIGYMAPEYAQWGHLTFKADVYSFGVVALEIVAGKSNVKFQSINKNCVCLVDQALDMQQNGGDLLELVDPNFGSDLDEKEALQVIIVALMCVNPSPVLRPTMSEVVSMLEKGIDSVHKQIIGDQHNSINIADVRDSGDQVVGRNPEEESQTIIRSKDMITTSTEASCSSPPKDLYPIN